MDTGVGVLGVATATLFELLGIGRPVLTVKSPGAFEGVDSSPGAFETAFGVGAVT